jgi:hypothetical protein
LGLALSVVELCHFCPSSLSQLYFLEDRHLFDEADDRSSVALEQVLLFVPVHQFVRLFSSPSFISQWRLKERLRTLNIAIVMCLNIGIDPPDVCRL